MMPYLYTVASILHDRKTDNLQVTNMVIRTDVECGKPTVERIATNKLNGELVQWDIDNGTDWEILGSCVADLNECGPEENEEVQRNVRRLKIAVVTLWVVIVFAVLSLFGGSILAWLRS